MKTLPSAMSWPLLLQGLTFLVINKPAENTRGNSFSRDLTKTFNDGTKVPFQFLVFNVRRVTPSEAGKLGDTLSFHLI
jgi:hypothetical protein